MKKKITAIVVGIALTIASVLGANTPAKDIAAVEPIHITVPTKQMLEDHKAEYEAELEAEAQEKYEHDKALYDQKIEQYKERIEIANDELEQIYKEQSKGTYVGCYELTAYIATGSPCASGVYPTVEHTVACNSLPLGTRIYIEGYGEFVVEDTGGMSGGVIDIFVPDYGAAIQFGRRTADVYVLDN